MANQAAFRDGLGSAQTAADKHGNGWLDYHGFSSLAGSPVQGGIGFNAAFRISGGFLHGTAHQGPRRCWLMCRGMLRRLPARSLYSRFCRLDWSGFRVRCRATMQHGACIGVVLPAVDHDDGIFFAHVFHYCGFGTVYSLNPLVL